MILGTEGQDPEEPNAASRATRRLEVPTQYSCDSPRCKLKAGLMPTSVSTGGE